MARLPVPGSDDNVWADLLNEYLLVSHNDDGTQRVESIPPHSVELGDLDVKNNADQNISDLVLTNDGSRLVWNDPGAVLRARSSLRLNVADFGAKGDGVTDDTLAIQAAIDKAENGGIIEIPRGTYKVRGLKVKRNGVTITGEARFGTRLSRIAGSIEPLIDLSGTASLDGHLKFCSVTNIMLSGDYQKGTLIRAYFADNFTFRDVSFRYSDGMSTDFVEVWDTRFYNCTWESCGSNEEPAMLFSNSMSPGQFGYGEDNSNQIHFLGCRWESFRNGAIKLHGAANGSTHLLNGFFFVSCKMETRHAAGPALQIMPGCTLIYVNQLYIAMMAAEPDQVKPLDAIEDWGSHIFMTDIYVQWGSEVNIANSLVHVMRSGPHMYYKLSTYYPSQDPVEAAVVAEDDTFDVIVSCNVVNRGRQFKGDHIIQMLLADPDVGINVPLNPSGTFRISSQATGKEIVKAIVNGTRPYFGAVNGTDFAGFSDTTTEKWRIVSSTGGARFAANKFQIDGTKGYVGINTTPASNIAMLIRPAADSDRGLTVVRPSSAANLRLMEFQDETYNVQGMAIDSNGRPIAVGKPPKVTAGDQTSYANPSPQVRDIAGFISAAVRPTPTAPGVICTVTFSRPYAAVPLSIALNDHSAIVGDLYVSARSESGFTVSTRAALRAGSILNFDYTVLA